MTISAPAKINLHLRVGPARADGFHPLLTWMTTISLFDELSLADNGTASQIELTCTEPSIPCDDRNLVVKAAKMLRQSNDQSVTIHLDKKIPHGGGLGGGSSDAAFTLSGLNEFWQLKMNRQELSDLAAQLGSDIPFFLYGPSSICRGRGEIVRPISPVKIARWVLLIFPATSMPTPAVYHQFDKMNLGRDSDIDQEPDWDRWAALPSLDLLPMLVNDLEPPAFAVEPTLNKLRQSIEQQLARPVRMSGSGSSLFTLYDDQTPATNAAELVKQHHAVRAMAIEMT